MRARGLREKEADEMSGGKDGRCPAGRQEMVRAGDDALRDWRDDAGDDRRRGMTFQDRTRLHLSVGELLDDAFVAGRVGVVVDALVEGFADRKHLQRQMQAEHHGHGGKFQPCSRQG
jgi:hypothetical protein